VVGFNEAQRSAKHSRLNLSNISKVSDPNALCKQLSKPIELSACYGLLERIPTAVSVQKWL